ncbi:MAG: DNA repair protein RecO [Anaerolineae bacterium]
MTRERLYRIEAIVLGRRDYGEADRVVIVLTPEGRLDLLAKGVRKPRSRKAGHVELFSRTALLVSRVKNSWDIISQAEVLAARDGLQATFERGTYARYVGELVLRFFEREADAALYTLVDATLTLLETATDAERVVRWYEQQLLTLAGFRPEWQQCVGEGEDGPCGRELHPRPADRRPYGVHPERGGALCPDCFVALREEATVGPLSPSALSWLQAFQARPYADLADLAFPSRTAAELDRVMERYISYHLERRPSIRRLMKKKSDV